MYIFILVIHIIASLILVAVILLQAGKGGGLAETFGGGSASSTIFGQKASVFLTRATTTSAILFLCTSLSLAVISSRRNISLMENVKLALPAKTSGPVKTVKQVKIDPKTGKEEVISEKVVPLTEEPAKKPISAQQ
ncbi:MAG: preprotein translocase subunit SecG [Candidatus Omnitrophica bacterium]|nr:preprotein translocase subunit SecG [Candidatus Omnitrophota bacterium]